MGIFTRHSISSYTANTSAKPQVAQYLESKNLVLKKSAREDDDYREIHRLNNLVAVLEVIHQIPKPLIHTLKETQFNVETLCDILNEEDFARINKPEVLKILHEANHYLKDVTQRNETRQVLDDICGITPESVSEDSQIRFTRMVEEDRERAKAVHDYAAERGR